MNTIAPPSATALAQWGARVHLSHGPRFQAKAAHICQEVAAFYDVQPGSLFQSGRPATVTLARQVAMHLLRKKTSATQAAIGFLFGGRDHGTVIHALKAVAKRRETDPSFHSGLLTLESHFS